MAKGRVRTAPHRKRAAPVRPPRIAKTAVIRRAQSVGVSIPKLEAAEKVTGRALYLDDLRVEGVLHGRTVRSTIARGRIARIELDPAFDWRGVTVCDWKDIPGE